MASSKKPRQSNTLPNSHDSRLVKHLEGFLSPLVGAGSKLLLAFSGGLDSRVLLELLVRLKPALQYELRAMHVHHGLSPNADSWAAFCEETCRSLAIPIEIAHVKVDKSGKQGIEAAARQVRYAALQAAGADYILLAHHEDDQAETLLLQLLRGAGPKGLAAMGGHTEHYLRPLLDVSRKELLEFARWHGLEWVDDESNADTGFDRNFCRHEILPVMEQRFPAVRHTLARSATHLAEASLLLDELAELDAGQAIQEGKLDVRNLARISNARGRNLLRWWLSSQGLEMPATAQLQEMLRQLLNAKPDACIKIAVGRNIWLRRYRNLAYLESGNVVAPSGLIWQGEPVLQLPDNSNLLFEKKTGKGLAVGRLGITRLRIGCRQGGEKFQPDARRPTRTLKHLLQEAGIPPSLRERLPLIFHGDTLVAVPGIGVAAGLQATGDESGVIISWQQCL